jgi:hypothetical protein
MTERNTSVVLRDPDQRCPGVAHAMRNSCRLSGHRMTFSGTPSRNCLASPPSTPPARKQSDLSPSQAFPSSNMVALSNTAIQGAKKDVKGGKKRWKWHPQWVAAAVVFNDIDDK